jgi:hypothetical protein
MVQGGEQAPTPEKPQQDFSALPLDQRRVKVMNYLHLQRGKTVKLHLRLENLSGTVVNVTASQVMLREANQKVKGINLEEVLGVS